MRTYGAMRMLEAHCKATGLWGVYMQSTSAPGLKDMMSAAPFLTLDGDPGDILINGRGFVFCDTQLEMEQVYNQIVGDDGPTELNSYAGPGRWYAISCDNEGVTLNENT